MGWNCFKSDDGTENNGEPQNVGNTLREKFPGLYKLIQRIKDLGAPTKLKRRFRRKRRTPKGVGNSPNDKISQSKGGVGKVDKTDDNTGQETKVSRPPTDDRGKLRKNVRRITVIAADVSQRVDDVSPDGEESWSGLTPDWVVVNDPHRFGIESSSDSSQTELSESELDTVAGELVDHVLRDLTSPTISQSQSPNSDLGAVASSLVEHVLGGLTSPIFQLSQSPDSDLDALATSLVDHVLNPAVLMSSSASLVGPRPTAPNKTPVLTTTFSECKCGDKVGTAKDAVSKVAENLVADKEVGIIPVDVTSTQGDKATTASPRHVRRARIPPQASHSTYY